MKKAVFSFLFIFLFVGCYLPFSDEYGWLYYNNSGDTVTIITNEKSYEIKDSGSLFITGNFEEPVISAKYKLKINEKFVYWENNNKTYNTTRYEILKSQEYKYFFYNDNDFDVIIHINQTHYPLRAKEELELSFWDNEPDFICLFNEYEIPFTKRKKDNCWYVYLI